MRICNGQSKAHTLLDLIFDDGTISIHIGWYSTIFVEMVKIRVVFPGLFFVNFYGIAPKGLCRVARGFIQFYFEHWG